MSKITAVRGWRKEPFRYILETVNSFMNSCHRVWYDYQIKTTFLETRIKHQRQKLKFHIYDGGHSVIMPEKIQCLHLFRGSLLVVDLGGRPTSLAAPRLQCSVTHHSHTERTCLSTWFLGGPLLTGRATPSVRHSVEACLCLLSTQNGMSQTVHASQSMTYRIVSLRVICRATF